MLQVVYSNNIRVTGYSTAFRCSVADDLTIPNPAYQKAKRQRRPTWGIDANLKLWLTDETGALILPRGYADQLKKHIENYGIPYVEATDFTSGMAVDFGDWNTDYTLREYQKELVDALIDAHGVAVAPAGSGKTIMGMKYIHAMGRATLWLTHTTDLMYQTKARAEATLKGVGRIGILGDGKRDYGDGKLIIASVKTLQANPDIIDALNPIIGVVIVDEAHHFPAAQFLETAARFKAKHIVGLTATPDRKDGLQTYMYMGIGPLRYTVNRASLYKFGQLVVPTVQFMYTQFDADPASEVYGDSVDAGGDDLDYIALMGKLIHDDARSTLIAKNIVRAVPQGPAIVLAESTRYCFMLREKVDALLAAEGKQHIKTAVVHAGLQRYAWRVAPDKATAERKAEEYGTECKYVDKLRRWQVKTPQYTEKELNDWRITAKQRKEIIQAATDGEIDILFATQLAREGLDIPHLSVGHCVTPKKGDTANEKSGAALEQEIGRIMRPDPKNPDKKAVWYDYVDDKVGIFKQQYYTRRKVYKRLGITVPSKKATERDTIDDFFKRQIF